MKNKPFVNQQTIDNHFLLNLVDEKFEFEFHEDAITLIEHFFNQENIQILLNNLKEKPWTPVGTDGILDNYNSKEIIGSYRLSIYNETFAHYLWQFMKPFFLFKKVDDFSNIENLNHFIWKPIGTNPLFRFIYYTANTGFLIPHYDAPYQFNDKKQTMKSFVIYLTTNDEGGETRFLNDEQDKLPFEKRHFADQFFTPKKENIKHIIQPVAGNAIAFDHRILHDSCPCNNDKIIIRTDIIYEKYYG